jgi:plasmid maintenance system antidote protein VapI
MALREKLVHAHRALHVTFLVGVIIWALRWHAAWVFGGLVMVQIILEKTMDALMKKRDAMTEKDHGGKFMPDWASAPGETIRDILDERNWTIEFFSLLMGLTLAETGQLLAGELRIDEPMAAKLDHVFNDNAKEAREFCVTPQRGPSADFWLRRQADYDADCLRKFHQGAQESITASLSGEQDQCPNPQMVEIILHEGRRGDHCVVVKMNGQERRATFSREGLGRASLTHGATFVLVRSLIKELEVLE